jgi:predicted DNA-binding transcriptional regulator AlpA
MERVDKLAYSVPELADVLGIGRNAAYELVNRDDFPSIRISEKRIVIPIDGLKAWLEEQSLLGVG